MFFKSHKFPLYSPFSHSSLPLMENKLKLKLSRIFRNSFGSCRTRNLPDVAEKAVFSSPINCSFHTIDSNLPSKVRPFPSICKSNLSEPSHSIENNCILSTIDVMLPRPNVSSKLLPSFNGRTCPPVSPILPLNPFYEIPNKYSSEQRKKKTLRSKKRDKTERKITQMNFCKKSELFPFSSSLDSNRLHGSWWYSSDDDDEREDETETLFSSKTVSSDSPERRRRNYRNSRKDQKNGRRRARCEMVLIPFKEGRVKDSFAVVKKSSDPYNDFRTSMVEMIIEKQIFVAEDLEQLLQCFLSLNSHRHRGVIIEVFMEIWEALFSST